MIKRRNSSSRTTISILILVILLLSFVLGYVLTTYAPIPKKDVKEFYPKSIKVLTIDGDTAIIKDFGNTTHQIVIERR